MLVLQVFAEKENMTMIEGSGDLISPTTYNYDGGR